MTETTSMQCVKYKYSTDKAHNCTACVGKDFHEGMIFILFRSSFHVSLTVHVSIAFTSNCCFHNPTIVCYFHFVSFCICLNECGGLAYQLNCINKN